MALSFVETAASQLNRLLSGRKPSVIRQQCLTCSRWLDGADLLFGFCAYCLEDRARQETQARFDNKNPFPKCYDCNQEVYLVGMKTWDNNARAWKLQCTRCGQHQVELDKQYTNTPWGYENKLK